MEHTGPSRSSLKFPASVKEYPSFSQTNSANNEKLGTRSPSELRAHVSLRRPSEERQTSPTTHSSSSSKEAERSQAESSSLARRKNPSPGIRVGVPSGWRPPIQPGAVRKIMSGSPSKANSKRRSGI